MFKQVIVPLDGSIEAESALAPAATITRAFGGSMLLLRAFEGPDRAVRSIAIMEAGPGLGNSLDPVTVDAIADAAAEAENRARAYLDHVSERFGRDLRIRMQTIDEPAEDAILAAAGDGKGVLVVMASHGRGGLERLLFGSVSDAVQRKSRVPVLIVPVQVAEPVEPAAAARQPAHVIDTRTPDGSSIQRPAMHRSRQEAGMMDIQIGAEVTGRDGKLGDISRLVVDEHSGHATDMIVKHGTIFGSERIVPISCITGVEDGAVRVDLDQEGFKALDGYAAHITGRDPDYVGPPSQDQEGTFRGNAVLDQMAAAGPLGGIGGSGKPLGYPGGEQLSPDNMQRPVLAEGTTVYDRFGEKVGTIGELAVAAANGTPTHLTLRRGVIFKHEAEIPAGWIDAIGTDGLVLTVTKAEVEQLEEANKD